MRGIAILTILLGASALAVPTAVDDTSLKTLSVWSNGAKEQVAFAVDPPISTPTTDPGGRIDVTLQRATEDGEWKTIDVDEQSRILARSDWFSDDGRSPSGRWVHDIELGEPFDGRIVYELVAGDPLEAKGRPVTSRLRIANRVPCLEDRKGNAIRDVSLRAGIPTTLYVRIRELESKRIVECSGRYEVRISGDASGVTLNGERTVTVLLDEGVASFEIESSSDGTSAGLVGRVLSIEGVALAVRDVRVDVTVAPQVSAVDHRE